MRSKVWNIPKDELLKQVNEAKSMKDLVRRLGLNSRSGSNDITVKRCLKHHGIDWTEVTYKGIHNVQRNYTRLSNEELFTENNEHSRHIVKNRILSEKLIEYKCSICGQEPFWNGKPMVLILDHINGVNNDNRISNLRFVCPNCNIQLDTNCRKNKTYSMDNISQSKVPKVIKQSNKPVNKNKPLKTELEKDILLLSNVKIGKKYGVSDNTIRKWLKSYELPYYQKDIINYRNKHLKFPTSF